MIIEAILNVFFGLTRGIINFLPLINLDDLPFSGADSWVIQILVIVAYWTPISALLPLIIFTVSVEVIQFKWAVFLRLKSFIPTWGN